MGPGKAANPRQPGTCEPWEVGSPMAPCWGPRALPACPTLQGCWGLWVGEPIANALHPPGVLRE